MSRISRLFETFWGTERRTRLVTAAVGATLTASVGCFALLPPGEWLLYLSYDLPFVFMSPGKTSDLAVRIVYLEKLDEHDCDTLDRTVQAELLDKLGEAGAGAVMYDVEFNRRSTDPISDKALADAMRQFRGVDPDNPLQGKPTRVVVIGADRDRIPEIEPQILHAVDNFGGVRIFTDSSSTVRLLPTYREPTLQASGPAEPLLAWQMVLALRGRIPDGGSDDQVPRWIKYAGPPVGRNDIERSAIPSISAAKLLSGAAPPGFVKDKIVVIGAMPYLTGEVPGKDLFRTPFHVFNNRSVPFMSGPEVHANMLVNLWDENWLTKSSENFDLLLVIIAGTFAGAGLTRLRPIRGILAALTGMLVLVCGGVLSSVYADFWFPWSVVAFLQIPVGLFWGTAAHFYVERFFRMKLTEEQRHLREIFSKYLSPQMLERLAAEGFQLKLGGEKVRVAMMFTDIESFADMCQRVRDPERIVETLNDYFYRTTDHIFSHDGVIIRFIGDAIFAVWGAPLPEPQAAQKAVRAAWKLFENDKLVVEGENLSTRIGLHYGEVLAGNIGGNRHVDYTLIGDAVNLTARLEGLNKILGTSILITDAIRDSLGTEFRTRLVGRFKVKGRSEITVVHELLGPVLQGEAPPWIAVYHEARTALEANDQEAAEALFSEASTLRGRHGDGPSRFFLERLKRGEPLQDGVVEMQEK